MGKDKKSINPADAFRREEKKRQQKRNAQQKTVQREVRSMLNDPQKIDEEIAKYQALSNENRLDKSLKDKIGELKQMKDVALKKQLIDKQFGKRVDDSAAAAAVTSLPTTQTATTDHSSSLGRRPDESVYYHPVYNLSGAPPPGMPVMYRPLPATHRPPLPQGGLTTRSPFPHSQGPFGHANPLGAMAVGGMNGIPLPPPRPSPAGLSQSSVPPQGQRPPPPLPSRRAREWKSEDAEDPLNPETKDYLDFRQRKSITADPRMVDQHVDVFAIPSLDVPSSTSFSSPAPIAEEIISLHTIQESHVVDNENPLSDGDSSSVAEGLPGMDMYSDSDESGNDSDGNDNASSAEQGPVTETSVREDVNLEANGTMLDKKHLPVDTSLSAMGPESVLSKRPPVRPLDAALTAFVPSVLKKKPRLFAPAPPSSLPTPLPVVSKESPPQPQPLSQDNASGTMDDEYLQFMNEIDQL